MVKKKATFFCISAMLHRFFRNVDFALCLPEL